MPLIDIHHVAVKCADVEASEHFYTRVLGMHKVDRPDFDFPGAWLQMGGTMFHLMGGYAAEDANGEFPPGSASVDHIALHAQDFDAMKQCMIDNGLDWKENDLPDFGIWQLFVRDPSEIVIEMNFKVASEPAGAVGPENKTLSKVGG